MDIRSDRVYDEFHNYIGIRLPKQCTVEQYDDAYAELNVFRKEWYGDYLNGASAIEVYVTKTGGTTLRFSTMSGSNGKGLNPLTYPDAVDARDLM